MQTKREYLCQVVDAKPQESPVFRHPFSKNGFPSPQDPRKTNLQQQILIQFQSFLNNKTLGVFNEQSQSYDHLTYKELLELSTALGSSFNEIESVTDSQNITIKPVGIYLSNRREWTLIDLATILYGYTSCPFYDTLGAESITYAMNLTKIRYLSHLEISICFVQSNTAKFIVESNLPYLKTIVTVGVMDQELLIKLKTKNLQIITWDEFLQRGKENLKPYPQIDPKTPFTLIFTSGTTGYPKATVQTHKNFITMMQALFEQQECFPLTKDDVYLSYLPLPHIFERIVQLAALSGGAEVNYSSGIIQNIAQDIQRCKPTYFITVPRVLNRFYEGIKQQITSLPVDIQTKFNQALQLKRDYLVKSGKMTHETLDAAFAKTRNILGGRQRLIITGAAPISPEVLDFLKATLCCQIIEVYGQTETAGGSFLTDYFDGTSGHIGGPTISQEFKLVSIPDMGYFTDPTVDGKVRGEICIRGASVIPGYFDNPTQTSEILDQEGWVHTGDVGEIVNGVVKIIDRKNNLFKLSQGKYLSSEHIERCYLKLAGINEVLVFGDPLQDYPVGIVVPDPKALQQWAAEINVKGDHEQLCNNNEVRQHVLNLLIQKGKQENLNGYEQISNVFLEAKVFAQLGIFTDTLKLQRNKAKCHYQLVIQNLYKNK